MNAERMDLSVWHRLAMDGVPSHAGQRAAAELRRYAIRGMQHSFSTS